MQQFNNNTLNKINTIINCDPKQCNHENCKMYNVEEHCCDAPRTIKMVSALLLEKFKEVSKDEN